VALKLIRRNLEVELRGVTHCLNLKHPNLIDIYDIRTDEHDDRWVIMEYISGASLEDMIARYPDGMPRDMATHWFEGICAGVAYLHDHGIVHRDLKPANIFIDEGHVKIGDYGLSKFISCSRRSGQTESVGTVHYMAPEIANGRYGREIDAYALGIILFEMLTGHVPFEGESVGEVLMKHLTAEPELSRLEEPFRSVVRGAMAKDPERRINNASEMAAMLRGASPSATPDAPYRAAAPTTYFDSSSATNTASAGAAAAESPWIASADAAPAGAAQGPVPLFGSVPNAEEAPTVIERADGFREFIFREPEPVWAAFQNGLNRFWTGIDARKLPGLVIGIGVVAIFTFPMWLAAIFACVAAYVGYFIVRVVLQVVLVHPMSPRRPVRPVYRAADARPQATPKPYAPAYAAQAPAPAAAKPAATPRFPIPNATANEGATKEQRAWRRRRQTTWRLAAYHELKSREPRHRASTLVASLLAAAAIAPVASLLACMFTIPDLSFEMFLWSSIVATVASWAIMIPAQLTEGRIEDQAPMRFTMLLAGALVGIVAWAAAHMMYLKLPASHEFMRPGDALSSDMLGWRSNELDSGFQSGFVNLPLPMYAAYFAFLFLVLRWWRQAEWTRGSRVNLWATAVAGAAGFFTSLLWWFPQPLGLIAAAVISFTVQLASPWLTPSRRKELAIAATTSA
jgi:hypothetical protein